MHVRQAGDDVGAAFNAHAFLESTRAANTVIKYGRGEAIFTQGDACDHVM